MDQLTCALGGIVTVDFENPQKPTVKKVNFDFDKQDFSILVVNTGGSHADLTEDYAAIPREMRAVAGQSAPCTWIRCKQIHIRFTLHVKKIKKVNPGIECFFKI